MALYINGSKVKININGSVFKLANTLSDSNISNVILTDSNGVILTDSNGVILTAQKEVE